MLVIRTALYKQPLPKFRVLLTFPSVSLWIPYKAYEGNDMNATIMPKEGCSIIAKSKFTKSQNKQLSNLSVCSEQVKMASGVVDASFPVSALVPKSETGVLNFLQKYPEYNGKDVTIAIFDSGVDPRATGLRETADGALKVIERFDCSGCGDTDVSKKVTAAADGCITGLSRRPLKLSSFMKQENKDGNEYRVGLKSLFDLYPSKIREKVANDTKLKIWDEPHKTATADVSRQLTAFELQNTDAQLMTLKDKLKKEDLENSLEVLNHFEKKYLDIRTTYDCVVFQGENCWYAVLDTTETGDLEKGLLIGEYSVTHEVKNVDDYLSISINVHDSGDVLEIVGMCSSHGTHVASIASGNHPDKDLDGVAPNAKIVSLTIGDGRLGSMETGTALVRAIIKVMELCNSGTKIDVINMSYGEHAHWSNSGRIGDLMNEVVNKYGVVWVASAGNHGPALCTIGTPPDISQPSCIGVGAYVSPQMMEAEYALREKLPANVYTWTSRDPCVDGGQGVTVCAPGAAIASVPEYTMAKAYLMNGTSMAAPHVAGAVALLISGLKQKGIKFSPYSIKRAICNTSTRLNYVDPFAQGSGLLNVEKAFEHLVQYSNQQENLIRFAIKVGIQNAKGIHLRQGVLKKPSEFNVVIEPMFFNEKEAATRDKLMFNVRLALVCSQPWIKCGAFLDLCYTSRTIVVKVDPVGLSPGVHTGSIKAFDTTCVEKGSLFAIPVTIIQPHIIDIEKTRVFSPSDNITFKPSTIQRDFILVPNNATWAVLKMISTDEKENQIGKFFVHTMQILPMKYCKALETMKILPVNSENETVHVFKCEQNNILELCITKYWSNIGDTTLKYSLEFHGITSGGANVMQAANGIHKLDVTALGNEEISPLAQLKTSTVVLRPSESRISPLSATRDVIPAGRQIYQNVLTYNLHIAKPQEVALCVPILCSVLYESEYESQFWMLFDSNKMMVACGDAYSNSNYSKLEKGDYVIKLQVRHEKKEVLEKISEACMQATFKLQNPLTLDIYDHYNQSVVGGKKVSSCQLSNSVPKSLFIAPISSERLSKACIPTHCSSLNGTITYAKEELGRKIDTCAFQYILVEGPAVKKANGSPKNNKPKSEEYKEGLRDYNCSMIPKLDLDLAAEIYKQVLAAYPKHLPAHLAYIQCLDPVEGKPQFPFAFTSWVKKGIDGDKPDLPKMTENLQKVVELATAVISEVEIEAMLAYYGLKVDNRADAQKIKANMDKQKGTFLEALVKKGVALCKLKIIDGEKDKELCSISGHLDEIDDIYTEIGKFVDYTDVKVICFSIWHAHAHQHNGRMLKYILKLYDDKLSKDVMEEARHVAAEKKWSHIVDAVNRTIVSANPMGYRPF